MSLNGDTTFFASSYLNYVYCIRMKLNGETVLKEIEIEKEKRESASNNIETNQASSKRRVFDDSILSFHDTISSLDERGGDAEEVAGTSDGNDFSLRRQKKRLGVVARNTLEAYYLRDRTPSVSHLQEDTCCIAHS